MGAVGHLPGIAHHSPRACHGRWLRPVSASMPGMWLPGMIDVVAAFDARTCPDPVPPGYAACMAYAGGSSASHAWDDAELGRVAHLPVLPTWVPTPGHEDPLEVANQFLTWLGDHQVPPVNESTGEHVHVLWDMETGQEPDAAWLTKAADRLSAHGYFNLVYGSTSTLFSQPARDGYIVAQPSGVPHLTLRPRVRGTQYEWNVDVPGGVIDRNVWDRQLLRGLWLRAA